MRERVRSVLPRLPKKPSPTSGGKCSKTPPKKSSWRWGAAKNCPRPNRIDQSKYHEPCASNGRQCNIVPRRFGVQEGGRSRGNWVMITPIFGQVQVYLGATRKFIECERRKLQLPKCGATVTRRGKQKLRPH